MQKVTFTQDNFQLTEKQEVLINLVENQQKAADKAADYYSTYTEDPYTKDIIKNVDSLKLDTYTYYDGSYQEDYASQCNPYLDEDILNNENFEDVAIQEAIDYFTYSY